MLKGNIISLRNLDKVKVLLTDFNKISKRITKQVCDGKCYVVEPRIIGAIEYNSRLAFVNNKLEVLYPLMGRDNYDLIVYNRETKRPAFIVEIKMKDINESMTGKIVTLAGLKQFISTEPSVKIYLNQLLKNIKAVC